MKQTAIIEYGEGNPVCHEEVLRLAAEVYFIAHRTSQVARDLRRPLDQSHAQSRVRLSFSQLLLCRP